MPAPERTEVNPSVELHLFGVFAEVVLPKSNRKRLKKLRRATMLLEWMARDGAIKPIGAKDRAAKDVAVEALEAWRHIELWLRRPR